MQCTSRLPCSHTSTLNFCPIIHKLLCPTSIDLEQAGFRYLGEFTIDFKNEVKRHPICICSHMAASIRYTNTGMLAGREKINRHCDNVTTGDLKSFSVDLNANPKTIF